MGVTNRRGKPRHFLMSVLYRLKKLMPLSKRGKVILFLDLAWIFQRFAEESVATDYRSGKYPSLRNAFLLDRIRPTDRILDLGCGSGELTATIAELVGHVCGIDHDVSCIAAARKTYPNIDFQATDAREFLPHAPRFNVLVLSHVLEHLDNPGAFLAEVSPQFDRIYIEVPDFDTATLNHVRAQLDNPLTYTDNDHVIEFDRDELLALVRGIGLIITAEEFRYGVLRLWCQSST